MKRHTKLALLIAILSSILYVLFVFNQPTAVKPTGKVVLKPAEKIAVKHSNILYSRQLSDIAFTLFAEDRSSKMGMKYVLSTIVNRAGGTNIKDMHAVVLQRKQYSCWVRGKRVKQTFKRKDKAMYVVALAMVKKAVEGGFKPVTAATHYYNPDKVTPYWQHQYLQIAAVGQHVFLIKKKA